MVPQTPWYKVEAMAEQRAYFVYILGSRPYGTLYIGVTNDIYGRTRQHRDGIGSKFTKTHNVHTLVWFEVYGDIEEAIQREKSLERWPRQWNINLIERDNPHWQDLYSHDAGVEIPLLNRPEPRNGS